MDREIREMTIGGVGGFRWCGETSDGVGRR